MANTQSTHIASVTGSPPIISKAHAGDGATYKSATGNIEFTPTQTNTLEVCRIPASAVLRKLEFAFDDLASTSCTLNIGLHENGSGTAAGTVIDADCFATAVDVGTAAVAMADYRYEVLDIDSTGDRVWELATGFTEAEALEEGTVTIVITSAAATGATAGTVAWNIEYSI